MKIKDMSEAEIQKVLKTDRGMAWAVNNMPKKLIEYSPVWFANNSPELFFKLDPNVLSNLNLGWVLKNHANWACDNRPWTVNDFCPSLLVEKRPHWMALNNPEFIWKSDREWMLKKYPLWVTLEKESELKYAIPIQLGDQSSAIPAFITNLINPIFKKAVRKANKNRIADELDEIKALEKAEVIDEKSNKKTEKIPITIGNLPGNPNFLSK